MIQVPQKTTQDVGTLQEIANILYCYLSAHDVAIILKTKLTTFREFVLLPCWMKLLILLGLLKRKPSLT